MGWIENVGSGFRVRRRCEGGIVTDSVYPTQEAAAARLAQLTAVRQRLHRHLSGTPAPTLRDWVDRWLPAHTAGPATLAKYELFLAGCLGTSSQRVSAPLWASDVSI
jgi:hypothetical protein